MNVWKKCWSTATRAENFHLLVWHKHKLSPCKQSPGSRENPLLRCRSSQDLVPSQDAATIQIAASKAWERPHQLTSSQLQDCRLQSSYRVSRFCHLKLKFDQQRNCILSPTYNILPFFFCCCCCCWPFSHGPAQLESNSRQSLKMQISLPPLLQLTSALLSLQLAKLIQKNHSWAGENSSPACLGMRFSYILLQSLSRTMQLAYLYTWFMLRDREKEKGNPSNHVVTTNQKHRI